MPSLSIYFLLSLFLCRALSSPVELEAEARARAATPFCSIVTLAVTKLHQQTAATSYCSSYLSITTPAPVTSTVTASNIQTVTVAGATRLTEDDFCYSGASSDKKRGAKNIGDLPFAADHIARHPSPKVAPVGPVHVEEARAYKTPVPKPACFSLYNAAPLISSACKCLSIATPAATTTTTTVTAAAAAAVVTTTTHPTSENFVLRDSVTNRYVRISDLSAPNGATFSFTEATAATGSSFTTGTLCHIIYNPTGHYLWVPMTTGGTARYYVGPQDNQSTVNVFVQPGTGAVSFVSSNEDVALYSCVEDSTGLWTLLESQGVSGYTYHTLIGEAV